MSKYHLEQKILTLSDNAVFNKDDNSIPSFTVDDVCFKQWDFNHGDGWAGDAWIATYDTQASNADEAYSQLYDKIKKIIPRVSLIGQSYISFLAQPFLITRADKSFVFFRHVRSDDPVGLMFMDDNREALEFLLADDSISQEFFLLWNDAVNTTGYTAKILLMCTAIHALTKKDNSDSDYNFISKILGVKLKDALFAQKIGVRQRLSHGEYLSGPEDSKINYVEEIHKAVIDYFNKNIFKKDLITKDVVHPQRNFIGNHSAGSFFISKDNIEILDLKSVSEEFNVHQDELYKVNYEFLHGKDVEDF